MNKYLTISLLFFSYVPASYGQQDTTTSETHHAIAQDDPAQFLTRVEVFNELQHHKAIEYLNVTTVRGVIALGKRFTTRIDIPIVYNSTNLSDYARSGLGDISVRLLGYKFMESGKSAILASVEFSFNTAQSPLLGSGKNIIIPVFTYSFRIPKRKTIVALSFQQFYSLWGDESRKEIRWTKLQAFHIKAWSKKIWSVVLPEFYLDHNNSGGSMDIEAYVFYRFTPRFAVWLKGGTGLFGDHPAKYQWTAETGLRYLMLRKANLAHSKK
ncbi:MAG TPA: hypothetical protein VEW65_08165 [Chryseolinea sp.]|nr:hypothetical protein [Chryseolinea sp.]